MRPRCKNKQPSESAGKNKGKVEGGGGGNQVEIGFSVLLVKVVVRVLCTNLRAK